MSDKICIWCKQDCSTKPRQKDNQGRYLCQECVKPFLDAMKPKEAAAPATAEADDGTLPLEPASRSGTKGLGAMGELLEQQVAKVSETCPSCGRTMARGAIICTHCGLNTETGRQLRSRVIQEKAPKEKKAKSQKSLSIEPNPLWVPGGFTVLFGVLYAAAFSDPTQYFVFFLVALAIFNLLFFLYVILAAFRDEHTLWGVIGIVSFFVPLVWMAMIFYIFFISYRTAMKLSCAMIILYTVLMIPLMMSWMETVQ